MNRYSFVLPITAVLMVGAPLFVTTPAHAQTEDELFKQSMTALKAERWEELERLNTKLIAIDSQWFPYFTNRAIARLNRNYFTESIADSNRAEALVLLKKGTAREHAIQVTHRCICYILQGDPVRAVIESVMACNIDGTLANAWKARAEAFYAVGDYDKAIYFLGEAQKRDKSIKRTFSQAEAKQNARKHTSIDINADTSADEAVGAKALEEKRYAAAIAPYTRVIEKSPTGVGGWLNRGTAHYYLKNYDKAIADWTTAFCIFHTTEASPETLSDVLVNRANTYRFSQPALLDEAQLDCELALKLQPDGKRAEAVLAKIKETREESDPKALLKRAIAVLEHEKDAPGNLLGVDAATKALDKAIELSPGNAQIWYWRGVAENTDAFGGRIGSKESALPFFDKAIDRNPKYSVAYLQRALVRLHLVGLKESDKALVASDLDKAIELGSGTAQAHIERGKLRMGRSEAIADFTAALNDEPENTEYLQYRALAYEAQKDWRNAIADWIVLLKNKPKASAYSHRGDDYFELKDYEKAIVDYTSAITLDGENVDHWLGRARALRLAGKKLLALADYQKAYALDKTVPKITPDLSNAAAVDKTRFDSDRAFRRIGAAAQKLASSSAELTKASLKKARQEARAQRVSRRESRSDDEVIKDVTDAIAQGIADEVDYFDRAHAYLSQNKPEEAIVDSTRAIALKSGYALAFNARGHGYMNKGDYEKGFLDYDRAVKLDPHEPWFVAYRGDANLALKRYDAAIADYNKALEVDPDFAVAKDKLEAARKKKAGG